MVRSVSDMARHHFKKMVKLKNGCKFAIDKTVTLTLDWDLTAAQAAFDRMVCAIAKCKSEAEAGSVLMQMVPSLSWDRYELSADDARAGGVATAGKSPGVLSARMAAVRSFGLPKMVTLWNWDGTRTDYVAEDVLQKDLLLAKLIGITVPVLKSIPAPFFLSAGSLLAHARDGLAVPLEWDDDVDFTVVCPTKEAYDLCNAHMETIVKPSVCEAGANLATFMDNGRQSHWKVFVYSEVELPGLQRKWTTQVAQPKGLDRLKRASLMKTVVDPAPRFYCATCLDVNVVRQRRDGGFSERPFMATPGGKQLAVFPGATCAGMREATFCTYKVPVPSMLAAQTYLKIAYGTAWKKPNRARRLSKRRNVSRQAVRRTLKCLLKQS